MSKFLYALFACFLFSINLNAQTDASLSQINFTFNVNTPSNWFHPDTLHYDLEYAFNGYPPLVIGITTDSNASIMPLVFLSDTVFIGVESADGSVQQIYSILWSEAPSSSQILAVIDSTYICDSYFYDGFFIVNLLEDDSINTFLETYGPLDTSISIVITGGATPGPCISHTYHFTDSAGITLESYIFYFIEDCDTLCGPNYSNSQLNLMGNTNGIWCWDYYSSVTAYQLLVDFPFTDSIEDYFETIDPDASYSILPTSVSGDFYDVVIVSENGLYTDSITITLVDTCTSPLSIAEIEMPAIGLYPNPVKDMLYLDTDLAIQELRVFDSFGKELIRKNMETSEHNIDLSALPNGIYILHLIGDNSNSNHKIIKD